MATLALQWNDRYDSDSYNDDLPYYDYNYGRAHLIIPYTLDANDMNFVCGSGFCYADQFFNYLKDAFDQLYVCVCGCVLWRCYSQLTARAVQICRGRSRLAEDADRGIALPRRRPPWACAGAYTLPRLRAQEGPRVGGASH